MRDTDGGIFDAALRREFTGGAYCNYKVKAGPPLIRLVVTPQQVEFRGRGLLRLFRRGPWMVPREQVKAVFAKQRKNLLPPRVWNIEIVTTDPSVWWTFWSPQRPEPILLSMEECGYPVDWTPHNWAGAPVE
ncbi:MULTISPECIES: hypothetical protein [unclassified Arthrobacter]|uniref:hypothetical protein n=1 Tax=unclassified Arthrobacter TaxID=235627 RepID=UPI0004828E83|nr:MULTISPECIES: hypothetical protein [unclassified Arthrobacter]GAP60682.1 hypothetical protein AHiyo1_42560 [Arthrobacter sp. Hiyo1]